LTIGSVASGSHVLECGDDAPHFFVPRHRRRELTSYVSDELEDLVVQEVTGAGYEVVEVRRGGSRSRPTVDVRIDRLDGTPVTVEDCALVSRALEPVLDGSAFVPERYVLEVSSPGVERPIKRPADWRRFTGRRAKVLSPQLGGRVEIEIIGLEGEPGAEVAVVRDARGTEHRLPLAEVKEARLAFHW
jgi:ribosome maturation factor RimP